MDEPVLRVLDKIEEAFPSTWRVDLDARAEVVSDRREVWANTLAPRDRPDIEAYGASLRM
ncbi:MAG: hypothetical protein HY511_09955 [Actinobacteria bacterium]|nr:hypothetical protein [Actinomycetota bacterium]